MWTRLSLALFLLGGLNATSAPAAEPPPLETPSRMFVIDFAQALGVESPRIGFLGGLRDDTPDALVETLHPTLFRIGHQFRGRIAGGLPAAIDRVQKLGAKYKLVISDLVNSQPTSSGDWTTYEADVKKLVTQVGAQADRVIWEPENEPDTGHKEIAKYYELYAHAFKALREACPAAQVCGPSFAFPSYDKYKAFLDYCRSNQLECNYLCWHYTGWDPHAPEAQKWRLGEMREFLTSYPEQQIKEIHCDEWGAGPDQPSADDPGRLQPGRAVVWFYFLEDVFHVDRACRANWGRADDYLGGIITPKNEPYPAYHAYRFYGETAGMERVAVKGNDRTMAALAHRAMPLDRPDDAARQIILGSIAKGKQTVKLELRNLAIEPYRIDVELLPATDLAVPLDASQIKHTRDYALEQKDGSVVVTLGGVVENQVYRLRFVTH